MIYSPLITKPANFSEPILTLNLDTKPNSYSDPIDSPTKQRKLSSTVELNETASTKSITSIQDLDKSPTDIKRKKPVTKSLNASPMIEMH